MKTLIRIMQGTGYILAVLGILAFDSSIGTSIVLIAAGGIFIYAFARMERNYYFAEKEGRLWDTRG